MLFLTLTAISEKIQYVLCTDFLLSVTSLKYWLYWFLKKNENSIIKIYNKGPYFARTLAAEDTLHKVNAIKLSTDFLRVLFVKTFSNLLKEIATSFYLPSKYRTVRTTRNWRQLLLLSENHMFWSLHLMRLRLPLTYSVSIGPSTFHDRKAKSKLTFF